MKNKKIRLIIIIAIAVIFLAVVVGVMIGVIRANSVNTESNLPQTIPHSESSVSQDNSEEKVAPIKPTESTDESDKTEKADIELDIGGYKPEYKEPSVGNVTIEYDTKEVEQ